MLVRARQRRLCDNAADHDSDDFHIVVFSVDADDRVLPVCALRAQLDPCVVDPVVASEDDGISDSGGDHVSVLCRFYVLSLGVLPLGAAPQCDDTPVGQARFVHRVTADAQAQIWRRLEDFPQSIVVDPHRFLCPFFERVPCRDPSAEVIRFVQRNPFAQQSNASFHSMDDLDPAFPGQGMQMVVDCRLMFHFQNFSELCPRGRPSRHFENCADSVQHFGLARGHLNAARLRFSCSSHRRSARAG